MAIGLAAMGYLIGSVPLAWILTWAVTGKDLRRQGSGNVGVMNTALSVGRWAGAAVLLGEAAKGAAAVLLARAFDGSTFSLGLTVLAAVVGTRWPIWLGGSGGRGNTVGAAALLLVSWPALAAFGLFWLLARLALQNHFTATRVTFLAWPILIAVLSPSVWLSVFAAATCAVYLTTHSRRSDDHLRIQRQYGGLGAFLAARPGSVKPPDAHH